MIKIARWIISILAAILLWPIVLLSIVLIIEIALTIGLISALAIWIYKGSKH